MEDSEESRGGKDVRGVLGGVGEHQGEWGTGEH